MRPAGTALVTGASAGIGREFCSQLAARGYDLLLVARAADRLAVLQRELESRYGVSATVLASDLSQDAGVDRVAARIAETPALTLLVNNAGFGTTGPVAAAPVAEQEAMLRLHVLAPMRLTRAALPGLLARRAGGIVNVASIAAFVASAGSVNYCASKAYLLSFTEGLAAEIGGTGVRAQALCPGFTRSEFHQRMGPAAGRRPRYLWMTADSVVRASLEQLERGGPVICVPGLKYKVIVGMLRVLPRGLVGRVTGRGFGRR